MAALIVAGEIAFYGPVYVKIVKKIVGLYQRCGQLAICGYRSTPYSPSLIIRVALYHLLEISVVQLDQGRAVYVQIYKVDGKLVHADI